MKKMNRTSRGFTLAELLMSVLVISIILFVLAPVITKRARENIAINFMNNNSKLYLYPTSDPECSAAVDGQKSVDCIFTVPQGVNKISAVIVSGGGGGAGAANPSLTYDNIKNVSSTTSASSKTETVIITDNLKKATINYMTGGGGGGGSAAYYRVVGGKMLDIECEKYNAIKIPAQYNGTGGDICVTKYNVGDPDGPPLPSGTQINAPGDVVNPSANIGCWRGRTAASCTAGSQGYSGCTRTLCSHYTVFNACKAYNHTNDLISVVFRMPLDKDTLAWNNVPSSIRQALGFCSNSSSGKASGAAICTDKPNAIYLADKLDNNGNKGVYTDMSARTVWVEAHGYSYSSSGFSFKPPYSQHKHEGLSAYSGRCVFERIRDDYFPNAAGGGGGSPIIKNYTIPENILAENVGGKIVIKSGAGGEGGNAWLAIDSVNGKAGKNGETSEVLVYNSSNTLKWGLRVQGGNGAKITEYTEEPEPNGADAKALKSCELYDGANWTSINCTVAGTSGYSGETYTDTYRETKGGNGGDCKYDGISTNGGTGAISKITESDNRPSNYQTLAEGSIGTGYGAGGGGGGGVLMIGGKEIMGYTCKGGSGGNGVVNITLTEVTQAAGGGAGGGGAFAKILDLEVTPGQQYPVRVGGGGIGGADNTPGENGGQSWIKIGGTTYAIGGGEGGRIGTPQVGATPAVHGLGGAGSVISSGVSGSAKESKNGTSGTAGDNVTDELTGEIIGSSGGCGGESGVGSTGATGGMNVCVEGASINGINATSLNFISPGNIFSQAQYGTAGSGGGGGGWDKREGGYAELGDGSAGLDGYVYIFWTEGN